MNPPEIRLIWITPRFPLGAPDGARHATCTLIQALASLNVGIDVISIIPAGESTNETEAKKQLNILSCSIVPRSSSKFFRLPSLKTPFTFRAFAARDVQKAVKEKLQTLLQQRNPSESVFVVFDGLHPFASLNEDDLPALLGRCRGVLYRAHNVETIFWEQCEARARTPWFRWFFRHQAALVRTFERRIAESASWIAPVSEEDALKFKTMAPKSKVIVTPIGMNIPEDQAIQPVPSSLGLELLFIGRLDWMPNRTGLTWFLEKIWPNLIAARPSLSLKIAGVGNGQWLEKFYGLNRIEFLGKVADIKPLYESCSLAIAPLFQGSGTRVKILEAARYGRAVLTTALGAEGTGLIPGISYFRAENESEWLSLLKTLTEDDCRKMGLVSLLTIRKNFDSVTIAEHLLRGLTGRVPN